MCACVCAHAGDERLALTEANDPPLSFSGRYRGVNCGPPSVGIQNETCSFATMDAILLLLAGKVEWRRADEPAVDDSEGQ